MQLISLFSLLLLGLISEIAATTLDLNTRADSNDDNDNAKDMITVTLLDCNPDTRFYSYRFVCSNSTTVDEDGNEKPNRNTCESQQQLPSDVLSPPSGSKGIPNWLAPLEDTMPKGCEPGPEGLGPIGQMRVEVGSEIWFGVVVFPESKDDDDNPKTLDVESRAMVSLHPCTTSLRGSADHRLSSNVTSRSTLIRVIVIISYTGGSIPQNWSR